MELDAERWMQMQMLRCASFPEAIPERMIFALPVFMLFAFL